VTTLSIAQAKAEAKKAGFKEPGLSIITAIAQAESGLAVHGPDNINSDQWHSRDRGILQINSHWHPEVSDSCAYNPACAFQAAFRISGGNNFSQWATFTGGQYKTFLSKTMSTTASTSPTILGFGTGDPCLGCGALGSAAYVKCHAALAAKVGPIPPCANAGIKANSPISRPSVDAATNCVTDPMSCIKAAFQPLFDALPGFGIHISLFFGALMLVIIGLWIVTRDPGKDTNSAVSHGLNNAARGVGTGIGGAFRRKKPARGATTIKQPTEAAKTEAVRNTAEAGIKRQQAEYKKQDAAAKEAAKYKYGDKRAGAVKA